MARVPLHWWWHRYQSNPPLPTPPKHIFGICHASAMGTRASPCGVNRKNVLVGCKLAWGPPTIQQSIVGGGGGIVVVAVVVTSFVRGAVVIVVGVL